MISGDGDPRRHVKGWNHSNYQAGFFAELAEHIYDRYVATPREPSEEMSLPADLPRFRRGSLATRRAATRCWTAYDRRQFAIHWGRVTQHADYLGAFRISCISKSPAGLFRNMTIQSARSIARKMWLSEVFYTPTTVYNEIRDDEIDKIEIKWRIRDWLSLTDAVNIPPNPRCAAHAAWSAGARTTAVEIVMDAAERAISRGGR